ncbi:MAG: CHASE4 domain-containing protein [Hyphomicrobium sp.]
MRIASKINAALFGAFACGTLATFAVLQATIQPRFNDIEHASALTDHKRVTDAFEAFTEKLETATQDYAFWDETYDFIQDHQVEEFISSNLAPEFKAVENLGVNSLIFLKADGSVLWGAAYDLESKEPMPALVKEIAHFSRSHPYLGYASPVAKRGMIRTSMGLVLVAIAPILKSDRSGPSRGKVISAKLLDVEAVKELTGVPFELQKISGGSNAIDLPAGVKLQTLPDDVQSKSIVNDIIGRPLVYLNANSPRDVSRAGSMAIRSAMMLMILAGLAAMGVLWAFLNRTVVSRIGALKAHFATAGSSGQIKQTAMTSSSDEIGALAKTFNEMAEQVNHLRDVVADSAYMSGLSEWAAGTLHNVRNGLAPVTVTTWQVEQLFDRGWLQNIDIAAAEHADSATTAERRKLLNAFLVGSASRLAEAGKQTIGLTGRINTASKSVLDMVAEFERYAHRKTEIETVDLLPLVTGVATTALADAKNVDLVLPPTSALVRGNSIILRQIISNVVINALEAIETQARRGRLEIAISARPGNETFTRIAITDNGEGLSQARLPTIFQRGVSSRHHRAGGLGLHWCANAVKVLGGSIHADSKGLGLGVSIFIDLPNIGSEIKEAA